MPENVTGHCQRVCGAKCCRYITVFLPAPRRKVDFDELSWFLAHEGVTVYVRGRRWHLEVATPCRYLTPDNLCAIYERRPDVCRQHDPRECENAASLDHSLHFSTKEEFDRWWAMRRKRQGQRRIASRP